jgi:hypothetical protein
MSFTQEQVDEIVGKRVNELKAAHASELAKKNAALQEVTAQLTELRPLAARAQEAEAQVVALREAGAREVAFRAVGLDGADADPLRQRLETYYKALAPKNEKGEPIPMHEWIVGDEAKADPVMAHFIRPAAGSPAPAGQPGSGTPAGAPAGQGSPGTPTLVQPGRAPTPGGKLTADQVKAEHRRLLDSGKKSEAAAFLKENMAAS